MARIAQARAGGCRDVDARAAARAVTASQVRVRLFALQYRFERPSQACTTVLTSKSFAEMRQGGTYNNRRGGYRHGRIHMSIGPYYRRLGRL